MFFLSVNFNSLKDYTKGLLTLNDIETNKINKKKKNESNSLDMLHIDQRLKCEYSSSYFNFIISF